MSTSIIPLLGQIAPPSQPDPSRGIAFLAVFGVAVLIIAVVSWLRRNHPDPDLEDSAKPATVAHAQAVDDGRPSPEIIAVIAAAVATTLGERARLASVHLVASAGSDHNHVPWALEGRRQIYTSHKVR